MLKLTPTRVLASLFSMAAAATVANAANATASNAQVPRWVASAQRVGASDERKTVTISAYLSFRNMGGLEKLIAAQSTPGSAQYGHHLTAAQFHAQFAPPKSDVMAVRNTLEKLGFKIQHIPASGFYIEATGTVKQIKTAFHVSQDVYKFHGIEMRANAEAPTLPANISRLVTFVGGLDETGALRQPAHIGQEESATRTASMPAGAHVGPNAPPPPYGLSEASYCSQYWGDHSASVTPAPTPYGSPQPWLNCGYTPQQMRQAYGADQVNLDGTGVTVAIVDAFASPQISYDANRYSSRHGLPALDDSNFAQNVPQGIYHVSAGAVCGPQGWYVEETLDVESVHSMAPGASILYVGSKDCFTDLDDAVYDTIDDEAANIITDSWGYSGEPGSEAEENVNNAEAMQAAAEGISVLFSSGDSGDVSQIQGVASGSWPSTSPWVTGVGGTTLALDSANGTKSEYGWGTYRALFTSPSVNSDGTQVTNSGVGAYSFYAGAGGGASLSQPQPGYQKGVVPSSLSTGTYSITGEPIPFGKPHRVAPDIAMDADPYSGFLMGFTYTVVTPGGDPGCTLHKKSANLEYCEFAEGGTSLASPTFAGVLALVNQSRFAHGLGTVGFVNPALYKAKVGAPGGTNAPIADVQAPSSPTALLRGYAATSTTVREVTINSVPGCADACEGLDDNFLYTTPGYDDVTGLGTPYLPELVKKLGQ